ncbi:hypothetical protein CO661_22670 [Sinorhizobium fredii]|uniref:Uncharacterized protein n=1 Tax=Rhizobium fredii TaxID=380 RepID=A0A2A6LTR9_RHIFR|nr:hypothetical protein CO661_22670 [Sinorhizobium fredii]
MAGTKARGRAFGFQFLQRRAYFQTHKGRCSTLNYCMFFSSNRLRFKETCSRQGDSKCSTMPSSFSWSRS